MITSSQQPEWLTAALDRAASGDGPEWLVRSLQAQEAAAAKKRKNRFFAPTPLERFRATVLAALERLEIDLELELELERGTQ